MRHVLKAIADILLAIDSVNLAVLRLLDLLAAFETLVQFTLLQRLETAFGLDGVVMKWCLHILSDAVRPHMSCIDKCNLLSAITTHQ